VPVRKRTRHPTPAPNRVVLCLRYCHLEELAGRDRCTSRQRAICGRFESDRDGFVRIRMCKREVPRALLEIFDDCRQANV
jgi:hypothetical protein